MSRVIDPNGAQVLPDVKDPRAYFSAWTVAACCSADQRTKSEVHRLLASRLVVVS